MNKKKLTRVTFLKNKKILMILNLFDKFVDVINIRI